MTAVAKGQPTNILLDAGESLLITAGSNGTAGVEVFRGGDTAPFESRGIAAGETEGIGPYSTAARVRITAFVDDAVTYETVSVDREVLRFGTVVEAVAGSTRTISNADHGKILDFAAGCTVTVPVGLRSDFACGWTQSGATAVVFQAGAGATLQSYSDALTSSGQYATGGMFCVGLNTIRLAGPLTA